MNRQVILAERPTGIPQACHFSLVDSPTPALELGWILVENHFLSVEPAMRGWLADTGNYSNPINVGDVMRAIGAGRVVDSRSDRFPVGALVTGWFGWQELAAVREQDVIREIKETDLPLSLSLGVLGLNGMAAYLGLTQVGVPAVGDTVVVSTAAGAVGSIVGQVARLLGCSTIVGVTSSAAKARLCVDVFGYDAAVEYASQDVLERLRALCPSGINVYFDNTAGHISDAVRKCLAIGARVVICGTASVSTWDPPPLGPRVERDLLTKRVRMQGFLAFDHRDKYEGAISKLAEWIRDGKLAWREDVLQGIESCADGIAGLYRGENMGKRVVKLR